MTRLLRGTELIPGEFYWCGNDIVQAKTREDYKRQEFATPIRSEVNYWFISYCTKIINRGYIGQVFEDVSVVWGTNDAEQFTPLLEI